MTRKEFATLMAYLSAAIGKAVTKETMEVYFDLLGDLDKDVLGMAVKRVALQHKWATFPSVAEIREAAVDASRGETRELSAQEAWGIAWEAAGKIDLDVEGSLERRTKDVPPLVLEAMRCYGMAALVYGKDPVGVIQAAFVKIYDQLAARERANALLPPKLKEQITNQRNKNLPGPTLKVLENLGEMEGDSDAG